MNKKNNPSKKGLRKNLYEKFNKTNVMFYDESEYEGYKLYKKRCYRNLIIKSLLSFLLGVLVAFLFKLLISSYTS